MKSFTPSPIPMSSDQLPQQRVSEVVTMPERPEGLITYSEFLDYYPDYPVSTPRNGSSWVVLNGLGHQCIPELIITT